MVEFIGKPQTIIFENPKDLFKIISVEISEQKTLDWPTSEIIVTGTIGELDYETNYQFQGEVITHPKFGEQFKCAYYEVLTPSSEQGLVRYLSGENFPGIGQKTAQKIVDQLGDHTLSALQNGLSSKQLQDLRLSKKQEESLTMGSLKIDNFSEIILQLGNLGLPKKVATTIYKLYGDKALELVKSNPYQLISEVSGIGFKRADEIALKLGIAYDSKERIQGAILQGLVSNTMVNGDSYQEATLVIDDTHHILNQSTFAGEITDDQILAELQRLVQEQKVIIDQQRLYLPLFYKRELDIADELKRFYDYQGEVNQADNVESVINQAEEHLGIDYDRTQKSAISMVLTHQFSLLTGGPGTGKTTVIKGIIDAFNHLDEKEHKKILLAAPTGRAAKRMSEVTGYQATTLHRLLGLVSDEQQAPEDSDTEIKGDLLIVDEMSMVDLLLFYQLTKALTPETKVVLVGDKDQLPSVGTGNVFSDLLKSDCFEKTELQTIHRQAETSSIVELAHAINHDQNKELIFEQEKDRSFIACSRNQVPSVVDQIVQRATQRGFSMDQVQVLTPMYSGESGINNLNRSLQQLLNPKTDSTTKEIEVGKHHFRINDRVLQLVNNPEKDIYNGQIGEVISLTPTNQAETMIVDFDGHEVTLSKKELNDLTLAYAISIHKSQGSEFPLIILVLTMQNSRMLKRNLLYTAITRASESLVMVGEKRAFQMAITTDGSNRKTTLALRLQATLQEKTEIKVTSSESEIDGKQNYLLTADLILSQQIDPMIGMADYPLQ
ncbi:ATP-dependent RecD-like DNA helicase [Holzapfeliella sp. He02]|uniref:ATP-dependent RecD2 DNA helicase n=1 Tax=Holzapfeliella saturejae TaxID=3082953 RepID=A0ABU8SG33_9LACO